MVKDIERGRKKDLYEFFQSENKYNITPNKFTLLVKQWCLATEVEYKEYSARGERRYILTKIK